MALSPPRDRVRDRRIERGRPGRRLRCCSRSCRRRGAREDRGRAGATEVAAILDLSDDRLLVVVGPCSVHDAEAALDYARPAERRGRRAERRPVRRDARLLREAAHHDGLEGHDQRPPPGRSGDVNSGLRLARGLLLEVLELGPPGRLRVPGPDHARSTSPTWSPGGRSARAPRRARSTASSPPASRCRSASRTAPTATSRWRLTRCGRLRRRTRSPASTMTGTPAILHTRGNPDCHVILRGGRGAPNHDADGHRGRARQAARGRASRAHGGRRLARQQREGPRQPAGRGRRRRRPGGRRERGDNGGDARVIPRGGPPGAGARRRAPVRPVDHRRLHGVGHDRRYAGGARRRRGRRAASDAGDGRSPRGRADRRVDRPGGARAARRGRGGRVRRSAASPAAAERGARSTRAAGSLDEAVDGADTAFVRGPVGACPRTSGRRWRRAGPDCVVTDVGSIKRAWWVAVHDERFVAATRWPAPRRPA